MASEGSRLHLFGTACWRGASCIELPDNLPGWLLAYLAYGGEWFARDALAALCWPDRPDAEAQHNLRANLHRARALAAGWGIGDRLEAERRRVRLHIDTDVAAFRAAVGRGDWREAVTLQPEALLTSLSFRGFALLEAWVRGEREALREAWHGAVLRRAHDAEGQGDAVQAADGLLQMLRRGSPTEDAVQALLRVAAAGGRRAEALAAYEQLCRHLHQDLGLAPTDATIELARALQTGVRAQPLPSPARAAGRVPRSVDQPPHLIGRDGERTVLADCAHAVVLVSGEPGVGKTRLVEEACPAARWVSCREGLEAVPFAALTDYLADHIDTLPDLGEHRRDLARLVPQLSAEELLPPAAPLHAKARLLDALAHVLEVGATTVVFDDLQWADAATGELILHLARRGRVALRLASRSNEAHAALDDLLDRLDAITGLQRLTLAPLSNAALAELLADLSHSASGPQRFARWLHGLTGGNPFFALQTLRALFESGRLRSHADGWSSDLDAISIDYCEFAMPPRVADLVRRRLQALDESTRRVLSAVAVIGRALDSERLASAVGLSAWAVAEAVAEAQAAGLLDEARFRHDVIRHAVLRATPAPLLRVLHATVARLFDGVLSAAELSSHWWAAGEVERAVAATLEAAEHEGHAGLHEQAIARPEQALARELPAPDVARLRVGLARMHLVLGRRAEAEAAIEDALAEPVWPRTRAMAYALRAEILLLQGRLQDAEAALTEATASDPDEPSVLAGRSKLKQLQGRVDEVVVQLERQRDAMRRRAPGPQLIEVLTSLGAAYDELGQPERGLPLHEEAWRLAARLGARYAQVEVAINWLWCLGALQRDDEAVAIARQALELGDYGASATLRNNLAWSLAELGRTVEASALYEELARGSDPTLALIAQAKLVDLRGAVDPGAIGTADVQPVLQAMASTEVYLALASASLPVLRYGSAEQVRAVLGYLRPQPLEPMLVDKLRVALSNRGIDPAPYLPAPPTAH
jgi:DNA-binding SARP family transcriptional activator/tetratricopeptide (TPR) repeat protein